MNAAGSTCLNIVTVSFGETFIGNSKNATERVKKLHIGM
jgi:hypothetical protein